MSGRNVLRLSVKRLARSEGRRGAVSEDDDVVVDTEPKPGAPERFRVTFPRQQCDRFNV